MSSRMRQVGAVVLGVVLFVTATGCTESTSTNSSSASTSTTAVSTTATSTTSIAPTSTTSAGEEPRSTESFTIPVGEDGVTYQLDGDPPSGPSSFVVLADGSVVVADTMAASRGEPRLLHYDRVGELISVVDLAEAEVSAIVDVDTFGGTLAVLDVHADRGIYRLVEIDLDGAVVSSTTIPDGSHFENGLTGLASDDIGILLEFQFGRRYERLNADGRSVTEATLVIDGHEVEVQSGQSRVATVRVGDSTWEVTRDTDLGGVTLVGVSSESIVVVVDEVDTSSGAFVVTRRIQRYTLSGDLVGEVTIDAGDQVVEIPRELELGADGGVLRLLSLPDRVEIVVLDL